MALEETYCANCGIVLKRIPLIGPKVYQFKEGWYCEPCAKAKVQKARGKQSTSTTKSNPIEGLF